MAETPTPTYRVEHGDEQDRFVCLIPDAGKSDGICGHVSMRLDYLQDHMQQRHTGIMVPEDEAPDEAPTGEPADSPETATHGPTAQADPISTPRTPDSQEAPPRGTPTPQPAPPMPTHPIVTPEEEPPASDVAGHAA